MPENTPQNNSPNGQNLAEDPGSQSLKLCACGCGQPLVTKSKWDYGLGRPRRFLPNHKATVPRIESICLGCGKTMLFPPWVSARKKFCSRECYRKHPVISRLPRGKSIPRIIMACVICYTEFTTTQREIEKKGRKCCSLKCANAFTALINKKRESKAPKTHRRRLLAIRPHRCEKCGYDKIPGILTVHHKDGNKANGADENLMLVCWNCHMEMEFLAGTGPYRRKKTEKKTIPENLLSRNERIYI